MDPQKQHKQGKKPKNPNKSDPSFQSSSTVKGLRFGGQLMIKKFTIRRASPLELQRLLSLQPPKPNPFPSTSVFIPTNFTILAQHAWHTLTLGLGTKKSKVILFVFESEQLRAGAEKSWPSEIALGDVNRRLVRGLNGCEMARFKFRKGCVTFYLYAVRPEGAVGFRRAEDLRQILQAVVQLNDFLDHTAMLAMPHQRSIGYVPPAPMAMAH
ncbi:uncharacterized protein LOC18436088 [Amborella trichopoda]|uniref:DUF7851 domain-containing protein n=1 Tax=Amborella trichopoda TaxID=13333 RepID=W1PD56_AMBTC|nr:uncharacterized protein LOC18436088 [Amborella trichopoda]ERN07852.1 hypothetical protein AMTR_s00012p00206440 [Amborella trichopoda]|eukprot:XP_006846177.1 uncharacterized protein LOC18436088 [Amborella trichopoda]